MDQPIHLLDSFSAQGSDGVTYKVMAYEHRVRDATLLPVGQAPRESNGLTEYRLADGERIELRALRPLSAQRQARLPLTWSSAACSTAVPTCRPRRG